MDKQKTMSYKQWVDNEYRLWIEALQVSAVHNFKDHSQVQRMLSTELTWVGPVPLQKNLDLVWKIDKIGYTVPVGISGCALRMLYYANEILKIDPPSIVEIGGGVGQFYAILRAIGYKGTYWIYDLQEVRRFQYKYLTEVMSQTGLDLTQRKRKDSYCISFHALGEFDDKTKSYYVKHVVNKCPHGYIVWNPHSGATEEVPFECKIVLQNDGSKLLLW